MAFTRKDGDFDGRTVSFSEGPKETILTFTKLLHVTALKHPSQLLHTILDLLSSLKISQNDTKAEKKQLYGYPK